MTETQTGRKNVKSVEHERNSMVVFHRTSKKYLPNIIEEGLRPHKLVTMKDREISWEEKMMQLRRQEIDEVFDSIDKRGNAGFSRRNSIYAYLAPNQGRSIPWGQVIIELTVDPARVLVAGMEYWDEALSSYIYNLPQAIIENGRKYWETAMTLDVYQQCDQPFERAEVLMPKREVLGLKVVQKFPLI